MSASLESTTISPPEPVWAKPTIGAYCLTVFFGVFVVAWIADMHDVLMMMAGATISAFTTIVQYYYGSSSGSARKTNMLAASTPVQPNP